MRLDSKTLGYLPSLDFPIVGPNGREYWPHQPEGKSGVARWRWGRDKVAEHYEELVFRRGFVYTKNYEKKGARPRSILDGERFGVTRTGRRDAEEALGVTGVFDFPKPVRPLSTYCPSPAARTRWSLISLQAQEPLPKPSLSSTARITVSAHSTWSKYPTPPSLLVPRATRVLKRSRISA